MAWSNFCIYVSMGFKFGREMDIIVSKVYVRDSQLVNYIGRLQIELENSNVYLQRRWAWQPTFAIHVIHTENTETFLSNLMSLALIITEIDSVSNTDQEYIYFIYASLIYTL